MALYCDDPKKIGAARDGTPAGGRPVAPGARRKPAEPVAHLPGRP